MNAPYITLSEVARRLNVLPKVLSEMIWLRKIDVSRTLLLGQVRAIPVDMIPEIRKLVSKRKTRKPQPATA